MNSCSCINSIKIELIALNLICLKVSKYNSYVSQNIISAIFYFLSETLDGREGKC